MINTNLAAYRLLKIYLIEAQLICNVMLISVIQKGDSVIQI